MSEIPTIGDVVREWRQYWRISLTDFCQQTKLSKGYVSELEHNKIENPKKDKLEVLAKALGISVIDMVSRCMPPRDRAAVTTSSSQQGVVGQGIQQVSADGEGDGEASEEEEVDSMVNAAIGIPDSLLDTLGRQIEEIKHLIDSVSLRADEKEVVASHLDTLKRLLKFIAAQRKV